MPRLSLQDAQKRFDVQAQGSYHHHGINGEYDEDDSSSPWNGCGSGVSQRRYQSHNPRRAQPLGRASSFDQEEDEDCHELEHRGRTYTQACVEEIMEQRDLYWTEIVKNERTDEIARQKEAVGNAIQAVEQHARQEFDKQHADYVKELGAYKEMATKEKDNMEKVLRAQNSDLERQLATLTQELNGLQLRMAQPSSKPQNQGSASAPPPPHATDELPRVPARANVRPPASLSRTSPVHPPPPYEASASPSQTPMKPPMKPPPLPSHLSHLSLKPPPLPSHLSLKPSPLPSHLKLPASPPAPPTPPPGSPPVPTLTSSPNSMALPFSSCGSVPKVQHFLQKLEVLHKWDTSESVSASGDVLLHTKAGASDLLAAASKYLGAKENSYAEIAYVKTLREFGLTDNHSLSACVDKAEKDRQVFMQEHFKCFQPTRSVLFLVKSRGVSYIVDHVSLAGVHITNSVICLHQYEDSEDIITFELHVPEIECYAALKIDRNLINDWFNCATFPASFKQHWNGSVENLEQLAKRQQPVLRLATQDV